MQATQASVTSFAVSGDLTAVFVAGRRVKCDCGADGLKYGTVVSSSYSDPSTTVVIAGDALTSNLESVEYGVDAPDSIPRASEALVGGVELATSAETQAGTDAARAVTPAGLASAAIFKTLLDANTLLGATVDNSPAALTALTAAQAFAILAGASRIAATSATWDIASASGTQDVTIADLGWTPNAMLMVLCVDGTSAVSIGMATGDFQACIVNIHPYIANAWNVAASKIARAYHSTGNYATATRLFIENGVRLSWAKAGTPTGTATCYFLFFR